MATDRGVLPGGWSWVLLVLLFGCEGAPSAEGRLGRELFTGRRALIGRIVGHEDPLPADAVRCGNCHQTEAAGAGPAAQEVGPRLGPGWLTGAIPRRGGPRSAYGLPSFCRLLRDGVDPAHVVIPQTMPRYTLTPAECEALWTFLLHP